MGITFNPLAVISFATLAPELRGDGTALLSLFRNIGAAIGISVTSFSLARFTQVSHADLAAGVTPFNDLLRNGLVGHFLDPASAAGAALLDVAINRQAAIIAYCDDYRLMMVATLAPLLLLPLMHRGRRPAPPAPTHAAMD
jgi:DHA2 family multidrug resistance protein